MKTLLCVLKRKHLYKTFSIQKYKMSFGDIVIEGKICPNCNKIKWIRTK